MKNRLRLLAIPLIVLGLGAFAGNARAGGLLGLGTINCGSTAAVFSPWGDAHPYYFTNNGGFESGSAGWSLAGGAQVVSGNEDSFLHSTQDSHSLLLPAGATAVSPSDCFGTNTPNIRFMATSPTGTGTVHVRIIAHGLLGVLSILDAGSTQVGPTWSPTIDFGTSFSQLSQLLLGANSIQLVITAEGGPVQLDDVYIDPGCWVG